MNPTAPADPIDLATRLIAAESVTPATGAVFDAIEPMLSAAGFAVTRFIDGGDDPDPENGGPVENLLATRAPIGGDGGRHFGFAGHLDVVPPGEGWHSGAFAPEIRGDLLYGRGAVDMKGAIACFIAAAQRVPADAGMLSLIITGDEEGAAIHGTRALMRHMAASGCAPEMILVGEPTSVDRLGDTMKIGRRGSVNMWIRVDGTQGHVAYPHLADNPIAKLVTILNEIAAIELDRGTDWFQPSNIETTDIAVGNPAHNVIPKSASARLSCRFNDLHKGAEIADRLRAIAEKHGGTLKAVVSGEAFLTPPGELSSLVQDAVASVTGIRPEASTSGGTSDARFLSALCPVVEFGLINATMHKLDEAVAVADLEALTDIYEAMLTRAFA
ncbi:MAG: succinyl-diaminopimelate desuccinylase [Sphingomonadales bacterium]|nr:succinyl-diaminopimelate desuccinylase [Sphingomonadales bacterium]